MSCVYTMCYKFDLDVYLLFNVGHLILVVLHPWITRTIRNACQKFNKALEEETNTRKTNESKEQETESATEEKA